jgi:hypothetical protein
MPRTCNRSSRADPRRAALDHLQPLDSGGFDALIPIHADRWAEFWRKADIRGPGRLAISRRCTSKAITCSFRPGMIRAFRSAHAPAG